jgi:hypothetical protein
MIARLMWDGAGRAATFHRNGAKTALLPALFSLSSYTSRIF